MPNVFDQGKARANSTMDVQDYDDLVEMRPKETTMKPRSRRES